jgi:serine/threonine-protein kinase ATR
MPYCFIDSARLLKVTREPLCALNELESSSTLLGLFIDQVVALTADSELDHMKAKVGVLFDCWILLILIYIYILIL